MVPSFGAPSFLGIQAFWMRPFAVTLLPVGSFPRPTPQNLTFRLRSTVFSRKYRSYRFTLSQHRASTDGLPDNPGDSYTAFFFVGQC